MIPRRYPASLAALAAGLVVLAIASASEGARFAMAGEEWFRNQSPTLQPDDYDEVAVIWAMTEALLRIPAWAVLGAAIAGITALVLLVLRARGQAGSASATASRVASTASSRS